MWVFLKGFFPSYPLEFFYTGKRMKIATAVNLAFPVRFTLATTEICTKGPPCLPIFYCQLNRLREIPPMAQFESAWHVAVDRFDRISGIAS